MRLVLALTVALSTANTTAKHHHSSTDPSATKELAPQPSAREFAHLAGCPATCSGLSHRVVVQTWHLAGADWARSFIVGALHELWGYGELVVSTPQAARDKLPPAKECTLALAVGGLGAVSVPFADTFALPANALKFVHLIREPFEMVVSTVLHHGHRGAECEQPAYRALCKHLEAKLSPSAQVPANATRMHLPSQGGHDNFASLLLAPPPSYSNGTCFSSPSPRGRCVS